MNDSLVLILLHLATVLPILTFKVTALIVGYFIAKLGHNLLIEGVSGRFKFSTEFRGMKADLVSASPGLFFILLAVILISIGILKDTPFDTHFSKTIKNHADKTDVSMQHSIIKEKPKFNEGLLEERSDE